MSKINDLIKELCPKGVIFKRLDDVCTKIYAGGTPSTSHEEYYGGNIKWLRSGEINFNELYDTEIKITEVGLNNSSAKIIPAHSVVIAMTGATVARTAMIMEEMSMNQSVCALIPKGELNYRFLYQLLANKYLELKQSGQGVLTSLNLDKIKKIVIPIPPIEVQNEIVRILDKFGELEAELEAELEVRKSQYEFWRRKLLFNPNYPIYKMEEICTINQGLQIPINQRKKEPGENRYFYITVQFLKNEGENYYIENPSESVICNKDDILVTRTGSTGKIIYGVEGCFHNNFFKVTPIINLNKRYLYHVLNSTQMFNEMLRVASGGTVPDLPHKKFYKLEIGLPSIEEQNKIVKTLDKFDKLVNDITIGIPAEIELRRKQYEYYRNKLLSFEELSVSE